MPAAEFQKLLDLMARLRAPGGCPWDRQQTMETLRAYLLEETYEVLDAMERGDWDQLAEELGDLQLQIVFQSQIAQEQGLFEVADVLRHINQKLIRRHPHVFAAESAANAGEVLVRWEQIKAEEKRAKASNVANEDRPSLLKGVTRSQPALMEARDLGKKAARVGFEWGELAPVFDKLREEIAELEQASAGGGPAALEDELGDLLFMVVNLARHLKINPELALRRTNRKFRERFAHIEEGLRSQGKTLEEATLDDMEELWQAAKRENQETEETEERSLR